MFFRNIQNTINPRLIKRKTGYPRPKKANCHILAGFTKFAKYDRNKTSANRILIQISIFLK
jgi:hypothetical protein